MCQMAGCLKTCKKCIHLKRCEETSVCMSIIETKKGLKCTKFNRKKEEKKND